MRGRVASTLDDASLLRQVLGVVDDAVIAADLDGRVIEWNTAATRLFGWAPSEVLGELLHEVLALELAPTDTALVAVCGMLGQRWTGRLAARRRDGDPVLVTCDELPLRDRAGKIVAMASVWGRIPGTTPTTAPGAGDGMLLLRLDGSVPYMSAALSRALGLPVGLDLLFATVVHPDDRAALTAVITRDGSSRGPVTLRLRGRDRGYRSFRFHVNDLTAAEPEALLLTGHPLDATAADRDDPAGEVLERRHHDRVEVVDALIDPLTGLPNGVLLVERLQALLDGLAETNRAAAVLYIDVDDFSAMNRELGEPACDEILVLLGRRLRRALRTEESVGRFSSDEFVVCADVDDEAGAEAIAARLGEVLSARAAVDGHEVYPSVSVGIALTRDPDAAPEELVRDADAAMHRAQERGRARVAVFDPGRQRQAM
jgi:diguanylate cyclase (GGDEF)-like protein/PAS domain S-box-containing protein